MRNALDTGGGNPSHHRDRSHLGMLTPQGWVISPTEEWSIP